jgi:hypothetical protein
MGFALIHRYLLLIRGLKVILLVVVCCNVNRILKSGQNCDRSEKSDQGLSTNLTFVEIENRLPFVGLLGAEADLS